MKLIVVCVLILLSQRSGIAQVLDAVDPKPPVTVHRLTVTPAAAPQPVLKYSLYPRYFEMKAENAVPHWKASLDALNDLGPLPEIEEPADVEPMNEIDRRLAPFAPVFEAAEHAALCDHVDWGLDLRSLQGRDVITVDLSSFQNRREFAHFLSSRTQLLISENRFEEAIDSMQVSFRHSYDVAELETLINDLLGIAMESITHRDVESFIDQPNSPNLYWAIAQIPDPLIDLQAGFEYEMQMFERWFPWMKDPQSVERTPEEWKRLMLETLTEASSAAGGSIFLSEIDADSNEDEIARAYEDYKQRNYSNAARLLVKNGYPLRNVQSMSPDQVLALREQILLKTQVQNIIALSLMPYPEAKRRYHELTEQGEKELQDTLAEVFLPAFFPAYTAQQRRQSIRHVFMTIEAIRMHLAENNGTFPASLDEITVVPVPDFPMTDEPFEYHLEGQTAVIDVLIPNWPQRYELIVDRKPGEN